MSLNDALGRALAEIRLARSLTQEDFSEVSSRTYISSLERGLKSPTLDKIDQIAGRLGVHPLTLLTSCYLKQDRPRRSDSLLSLVATELAALRGGASVTATPKPARGRTSK